MKTCDDQNCAKHGSTSTRGRIFSGKVKSAKMQKTATIMWERRHFIPKFERYERRFTKIKAHNPSCIQAQEGDIVKIMECRPLSKTKHFIIIGKNETN